MTPRLKNREYAWLREAIRKNGGLTREAQASSLQDILFELGSAEVGVRFPCKFSDELKREFMLIENRIKRKIEYEKTDREDKDESRSRKRTRDQVFPIKG